MDTQTEDGNEAYQQLSDSQEKLLAILPIPSAILSIFGSVVILFMAFKSRRKTHWTTYHALLTGISLTEIIFSITLAAGNFLYPRETSNRIWAFGNEGIVPLLYLVGGLSMDNPYLFCSSVLQPLVMPLDS